MGDIEMLEFQLKLLGVTYSPIATFIHPYKLLFKDRDLDLEVAKACKIAGFTPILCYDGILGIEFNLYPTPLKVKLGDD